MQYLASSWNFVLTFLGEDALRLAPGDEIPSVLEEHLVKRGSVATSVVDNDAFPACYHLCSPFVVGT